MKTINTVFLILFVSLAASAAFAQSDLSIGYQTTKTAINTFVQKVEGAGSLTAAVQTAAGGYVTITQIDDTSILVRKIKASGQKQWERRFDDSGRITGITQTTDGGFMLAGTTGCGECGPVVAGLIKLNTNGTVAWGKGIVETGGFSSDFFASVVPMPDGGVIAIGGLLANPYLIIIVRVTATGDVVWKRNFERLSGPIHSTATPDDGFIVAFGIAVLKITNSGDVVWKKQLQLNVRRFVLQSVGATADGGVILVGTRRNSNKLKVVVLKADGTLNWNAAYSIKVPGRIISVSSPIQASDGGYVLTGSTYHKSAKKSYGFIVKIDSSRKIAFQSTFGGDVAGAVFATADGGSLLFGSSVGSTSSDLLVLKVNSEGIVPGCDFFQSRGETIHTSFGRLKIEELSITESDDVSLESNDFGLTSVVTNNPVSTVCH